MICDPFEMLNYFLVLGLSQVLSTGLVSLRLNAYSGGFSVATYI
jgi:hypothetical protein